MKDTRNLPLVDVDALRVGMFVHLDMGWLRHPFPLSSFCISSAEQISTLRGLALKKLRWSPQASELKEPFPVARDLPDADVESGAAVSDNPYDDVVCSLRWEWEIRRSECPNWAFRSSKSLVST